MTIAEEKATRVYTDNEGFVFDDERKAFVKGYNEGIKDSIEKACDVYCLLCDTKECENYGECSWVKKFEKQLKKEL